MKKALITGITGQDGSYLAELLIAKGYTVHGTARPTTDPARSWIEHLVRDKNIYGRVLFLHQGNLTDGTTLRRIVREVQPDELYHLAAGPGHVGVSFKMPESTCEEIGMATLRLLEIARNQEKPLRFYHASSAEIFGGTKSVPQDENTAYTPISPYGCAKAFATQLGQVYRRAHGMFVCNGILYGHESPRRGENFVTRKIARAAARISRGLDDQLVLGNTKSQRDWGRAQDYVHAMWLTLQHDTADDYVVATGESHSVQEFVELAFAAVDLPWQKYLKHDPMLNRPTDPTQLVGCADKIRKTLGWHPTGSFSELVREMVEAELRAVKG